MDMPVAQQAKLIAALGPALRDARPKHEDPRLRPQLVGAPRRHRQRRRRARTPRPSTRPTLLHSAAARWLAGTAFHCYAGDPSRQTELHHRFPRQGRLVHRVLGLARADRPAGAGLRRHAEVAHAQPRARRHPQLGQDRRQLEPRARPGRRPAQRRLRHLHRRRDGRTGQTRDANAEYYTLGHLARFVKPGRGADREHVVRHDRLERRDHGRRVPQPRRLDRARRAQRERRPAHVRRRAGQVVVRVHAARWRARDLHLAGARARRRLARCSMPAARRLRTSGRVDDDATTAWSRCDQQAGQ